jgi:hypothetical protein
MRPDKTAFALDALGVECLGPGPIAPDGLPARGRKFQRIDYADYDLARGPIGANLPATEHVMYTNCLPVAARPGAEVLVDVILSEFDRTYQHFMSHNQAPSSGRVGSATIVRNGNSLYFAHKIFEQYSQYARRGSSGCSSTAWTCCCPSQRCVTTGRAPCWRP